MGLLGQSTIRLSNHPRASDPHSVDGRSYCMSASGWVQLIPSSEPVSIEVSVRGTGVPCVLLDVLVGP